MNLTEAIRTRRSVGAFTSQPVDPALVMDLLETAVWVPNHRLTEPWRFVFLSGEAIEQYANIRREMALDTCALEDEAARKQVGEGTYAKFAHIPALLAVIMKEHADAEIREEDTISTACVVQNFLLLAWEQGLGSFWKTFKKDARLRALLEMSDDEVVVGWVHLGYPDGETPTPARKATHERITILGDVRESSPAPAQVS